MCESAPQSGFGKRLRYEGISRSVLKGTAPSHVIQSAKLHGLCLAGITSWVALGELFVPVWNILLCGFTSHGINSRFGG